MQQIQLTKKQFDRNLLYFILEKQQIKVLDMLHSVRTRGFKFSINKIQ